MMWFKKTAIAVLVIGTWNGAKAQTKSVAGTWVGQFIMKEDIRVPFNFEIDKELNVYFLNAEERYPSGKAKLSKDSLIIPLDQFDNELAFRMNKGALKGVWRKQNGTGNPLAATAVKGKQRFSKINLKPAADLTGSYTVIFKSETGEEEQSVGVFKQTGNKLYATFLHVDGDSRYLEGSIWGNVFYLSSFIGSSPKYYSGVVVGQGNIAGRQVGINSDRIFSGSRNDTASLADPYQLTTLKDNHTTLDFSFPDINGKKISLKDDRYKNKVVVVTIGGTWCPNCTDETAFLSPWYEKNKHRGVEVISLQYERQSDSAYVTKVIRRFREKFNITYAQLFGGIANKDSVMVSLPALKSFSSFPTTFFIDRNGNVVKIHTGFSGPATGKYYDIFIMEFNKEIDNLLNK